MKYICLYFQIHQPYRLNPISFFDIQNNLPVFNDSLNESVFKKAADSCYLPTNKLFNKLFQKHEELRITFSISGTAMQQMHTYQPAVLESLQNLLETEKVEFLSETCNHGLSSVNDLWHFSEQVLKHKALLKKYFDYEPVIFRNTELIYSNKIGSCLNGMGFKAIMIEGVNKLLKGRSPNQLYHHPRHNNLKLFLKNYHLSDDIAFRFSDKMWSEWPLTAEKFTHMIDRIPEKNAIINLFMDYETFGEHQPKDSGIFSFLEQLPMAVSKRKDIQFILPSKAIKRLKSKDNMDVMIPISWADQERDLSPWLGNYLQREAFDYVSSLRDKVKERNNGELSRVWDYLMTSDHLYYMSTKTLNDGHIHQYFSPYKSPYDAFINFMNAVTNLDYQLDRLN